jgi:hypothetical protein
MIAKVQKPPRTQRVFTDDWLELKYLCRKVHYWLYTRMNKSVAQRYAKRLDAILARLSDNDVAILRQEGLALVNELGGDLEKAIRHRRREIELIERLHVLAKDVSRSTRAYMLQNYGVAELKTRHLILESLQQRIVQTNGAMRKAN